MTVANTLAYYYTELITAVNVFHDPSLVLLHLVEKARVFIRGNFFQPSLVIEH